jgi:hypothetical protein
VVVAVGLIILLVVTIILIIVIILLRLFLSFAMLLLSSIDVLLQHLMSRAGRIRGAQWVTTSFALVMP